MANNSYQFEQVDLASLPEKIDEKGFVSLCEKVLGIKWNIFYYIFFIHSLSNRIFKIKIKVNEKILISNKYKLKWESHLLGLKLELELLSNLVLTSLVFVRFLDDFILLS